MWYVLVGLYLFSYLHFHSQIHRVQNVHLRQAFEVQRQQLEAKNGAPVGAGEKILYHGTTAQACQSIMKNGFNRSFAGQNGMIAIISLRFVVTVTVKYSTGNYQADMKWSITDKSSNYFCLLDHTLILCEVSVTYIKKQAGWMFYNFIST